MRRENSKNCRGGNKNIEGEINKIVEEGIKKLRTEIKLKRGRGKQNIVRSVKEKDGLPSLTILIESLI